MIVDCEGCVMRDLACGDCVVTFLLGPPEALGSAEQVALAALADGGLVPPLRMRALAGPGDSDGRVGPVSAAAPGRRSEQAPGAATA
jgi:hypothetical protein